VIIFLFDGWWRAIEIDAFSMFLTENASDSIHIMVNEFCYANETVFGLNGENGYMSIMSLLDSRPGSGTVKGDGSTPDTTVSEFER
jgi:hypothetical protein